MPRSGHAVAAAPARVEADREGWLKIERGAIGVGKDDPGYDVDLAVEAGNGQMQRWLVGFVPFGDLMASGHASHARAQPTRPGVPDLVRHLLFR